MFSVWGLRYNFKTWGKIPLNILCIGFELDQKAIHIDEMNLTFWINSGTWVIYARDMWTPTKRYKINLAIVWRVTESEENLEAARQLRIYFNISDMQCWLKGRDRWRKKKNKEFGSHERFSGPKSQKALILFRKGKVLRGFEKM